MLAQADVRADRLAGAYWPIAGTPQSIGMLGMMKTSMVALAGICLCLSGCGYLPSVKYKLSVRPVKHVPCSKGFPCGSLTVAPDAAEGFVVIAGWKRYEDVTEPASGADLSHAARENRFYQYAADVVVQHGYCRTAHVLEGQRSIRGWEGSGDRGAYVVCSR